MLLGCRGIRLEGGDVVGSGGPRGRDRLGRDMLSLGICPTSSDQSRNADGLGFVEVMMVRVCKCFPRRLAVRMEFLSEFGKF